MSEESSTLIEFSALLADAVSSVRGRPRLVRATTIPLRGRRHLPMVAESADGDDTPVDFDRPQTRGDCCEGGRFEARPCPYVGCRYHLYLDVSDSGSIKLNFPDLEPDELRETCALDVADRLGATLEEVGDFVNLTRERIRQVEEGALRQLQRDTDFRINVDR